MSATLSQLLAILLPIFVGIAAKYAWDLIEKAPLALDKLPAIIKPLAVALVAWVIGLIANALQIQLPADLHVWTAGTVTTLISAIFAVITHLAAKASTAPVAQNPAPTGIASQNLTKAS